MLCPRNSPSSLHGEVTVVGGICAGTQRYWLSFRLCLWTTYLVSIISHSWLVQNDELGSIDSCRGSCDNPGSSSFSGGEIEFFHRAPGPECKMTSVLPGGAAILCRSANP
ncbi:unnamed protein product [Protopolystoma xenopodis]|uniref:Uncharacterized protein n=1 Tax=Protopolystoma xenopodis TaxID=117903 RepID=A0A448XT92_9PLAT|nr:unnamed protein product [Protopolystoma xenopodis]